MEKYWITTNPFYVYVECRRQAKKNPFFVDIFKNHIFIVKMHPNEYNQA